MVSPTVVGYERSTIGAPVAVYISRDEFGQFHTRTIIQVRRLWLDSNSQKFFGSFFQKRTSFLSSLLHLAKASANHRNAGPITAPAGVMRLTG
jgi:hypothetical protein